MVCKSYPEVVIKTKIKFQGMNRGKELCQEHKNSCAPNFYKKRGNKRDVLVTTL